MPQGRARNPRGVATVTVRRASYLTTWLRVEYNVVRLDQGDFVRALIATPAFATSSRRA
jgi:hypothetical protein